MFVHWSWINRILLKYTLGWDDFIFFLLNIISCACLLGSGLKLIFHWKAQSPINFKSLLISLEEVLRSSAMENKEVSLKNLYGPFLWMGFNCLKARATSRRQFTIYHWAPRNSWYLLYRPRKDERLSRPWSHPVVLNTGPLDWESSALTTQQITYICF